MCKTLVAKWKLSQRTTQGVCAFLDFSPISSAPKLRMDGGTDPSPFLSFSLCSCICTYRASLNVCVAYSSQDEMAAAVQRVAASPTTTTSNLSTADTTAALDAALYTSRNPHWTAPDLLVRTSGVARLSDYLLWQIAQHTALFVLPCFWPDIGIADVVPVLLAWQAQACLVALSSWLRLA